jgi:sugar lactone lactonase YvrE
LKTKNKTGRILGGKMTKLYLIFILAMFTTISGLTILKEDNSGFKTPESVNYDKNNGCFYISNINGRPTERDGNGFISRIDEISGEVDLKWVTGLNAPKGATVCDNYLYVTDINNLVKIDIKKRKIVKSYKVRGSQFLNDCVADAKGNIYFSDSSGGNSKIYRFNNENIEEWISDEQIARPNGLMIKDNFLYVGNSGFNNIMKINLETKEISLFMQTPTAIDGIDFIDDQSMIISDWAGRISRVHKSGKSELIFDGTSEGINAADFEYLNEEKKLIVPTFHHNTIRFYQIGD